MSLSLGMPKAPQGNIQGISKQQILGMPRKASPLFISNIIGNLTWSYVFIRHMICVLLGASIYFVSIFLLLFRIMFASLFSIKMSRIAFTMLFFASIHVAVSKQKVYRCCKNSLEKSENDIILKLFAYSALINLI